MTRRFPTDAGGVPGRCTRARALADGILTEVPAALAAEAGIRWPVALTAAAWSEAIGASPVTDATAPTGDHTGSQWDILTMIRLVIRHGDPRQRRRPVELYRARTDGNPDGDPELVTLHLVVGPGDHGEPVLTLMLPDEE